MLPIELPPLESNNRLLQLPAPVPQGEKKRPTAPNPSSGYIIAVG
jgi:hypothetical protein